MEDGTEKCETILDGLDVHSYDGSATAACARHEEIGCAVEGEGLLPV